MLNALPAIVAHMIVGHADRIDALFRRNLQGRLAGRIFDLFRVVIIGGILPDHGTFQIGEYQGGIPPQLRRLGKQAAVAGGLAIGAHIAAQAHIAHKGQLHLIVIHRRTSHLLACIGIPGHEIQAQGQSRQHHHRNENSVPGGKRPAHHIPPGHDTDLLLEGQLAGCFFLVIALIIV